MSGKGITQALVEMQLHLCPEYSLSNKSSKFYKISSVLTKIMITRGQSNLTKSASRGAHSPVMGHPRGSKVVPLNSWGRVSYYCSTVTIGLGCTVWPQCTRVTTNQPTTNQPTNDQRRHDTAYLNKRLFY